VTGLAKDADEGWGLSTAPWAVAAPEDAAAVSGADPSTAPSLKSFEVVRRQTECVFAGGTRLWGAEPWEPGAYLRNLDRFAALLTRFTAVADLQRLDGIVLEVAEPRAGATVEQLAATTRTSSTAWPCVTRRRHPARRSTIHTGG
jgi:hypothetical protein